MIFFTIQCPLIPQIFDVIQLTVIQRGTLSRQRHKEVMVMDSLALQQICSFAVLLARFNCTGAIGSKIIRELV